MILKLLSGLLASVMVLSSVNGATMAADSRQRSSVSVPAAVLQYDEPASSTSSSETWKRATLPIGNGIIGANVYGELSREHLTVNEETLWSGGRGSVTNYNGGNPSSSKVSTYNNYANQLLNGSVLTNVEGLAGVSQSNSGYNNGYQALGDLYITVANAPSSKPSDYRRTLDLDNGLATVTYGSSSRTFFVSNPDNVLVSRFEGSNVGLTVSFTSKQTASTSASTSGGVGYITVSGTVSNNKLMHNTQLAVVPTGGSVSASGSSVTVSGASAVTIYLTSATDYKNTFWDDAQTTEYYYRTGETSDQLNARVRSTLTAAVNKGYAAVLAAHLVDYKGLYDRVKLDLGQESSRMTDNLLRAYQNGTATAAEQRYLEVLLFQYGRYLLIAGSRANSQLPTTLQGIWNDSNTAPWYSDIHTNINEQMNYWLSNNCNLTECALPLVQYMADLAIPGHRTVEIYTGASHGIMAHTQNTPFGYTSPGWSIDTWGWSPAASTWLMQNCYDYYEFSGDVETLRNVIYPYLKDQVLMYQELLKPYNGRLVMPITQSPEINIITAGNTYEQSLIWQLYADTIEAAQVLGVDADMIAGWQSTMDQLKPIEIGTSGQVKEWYHETTINSVSNTSGHRHLSNMLGLYPGNLFDTEEELAAARVSLNNKNFGRVGTSNNPEGGWTYGQLINSWARVFDGENAYFSVQQMIKNRLFVNLWDYHNPTHFQIDANYGYSAGVGEMLVQSNLGYINLLPAIPSVWANGSVEGLLCEGNFEVSMNWTDGSLVSATITSGKGGSCSVKLQPSMILKDASGAVLARYDASNPIVTVNTSAGDVLTIESSALRVTAERVWDGSVNLTWNALPDSTYSVSADGTVVATGITSGSYTHADAPAAAVTYTVSTLGDAADVTVDAIVSQTEIGSSVSYEMITDNLPSDGVYVIVGANSGVSTGHGVRNDRYAPSIANYIKGDVVENFSGVESYEWEIKAVSGGYTVQAVSGGQYLRMSNNNTTMTDASTSPVTLEIGGNTNFANSFYFKNTSSGAYLNYRTNNNGSAGTWTVADGGSAWYLFQRHVTADKYAISPDVLASAEAAVGDKTSPEYEAAMATAQGEFSTREEAEDAYQALVAAIRALLDCPHTSTHIGNVLEATCTEPGHTGDTICDVCGRVVAEGGEIPALGHDLSDWSLAVHPGCTTTGKETRSCTRCDYSENRSVKALGHERSGERTGVLEATCTEPGYTGDVHCTRCDTLLESGTATTALGHSYSDGTCIRCGEAELPRDLVEVGAAKGGVLKLQLTGTFTDLENIDSYEITGQGFVIMPTARLGQQELTVATPGRTQVVVKNVRGDGTWVYSFSPKSVSMEYTVRSYVRCGNTYIYSDPFTATYNQVKNG